MDRVKQHIDEAMTNKVMPVFEADKGYDSEELRTKLLQRKIFPWICRRKKTGKEAQKIESVFKRIRWKVERAIAWL